MDGTLIRRKLRVVRAFIVLSLGFTLIASGVGMRVVEHRSCTVSNESREGVVDLAERFYKAAGSPPELAGAVKQFQEDYAPKDC